MQLIAVPCGFDITFEAILSSSSISFYSKPHFAIHLHVRMLISGRCLAAAPRPADAETHLSVNGCPSDTFASVSGHTGSCERMTG
jgi:hypothetical protein